MSHTPVMDLLPLKPDVFSILLVLLGEDAHGYRIMQRARERSLDGGQLQPGALYRVLKNMLADALIAELQENDAPTDGDGRRRYYRITSRGRAVATAEAQRMADLVSLSRAHRLLDEPEAT